jgi:uncharacterized protein
MTIEVNGCVVELLVDKAVYLPHSATLVIADVHLGKARHFRAEGIPFPAAAQHPDYVALGSLFRNRSPKSVVFLGDLFHSRFNADWHLFTQLIEAFPHIAFTLVRGNHDIIDESLFRAVNFRVVDFLEDEFFLYSHDVHPQLPVGKRNLVGHIHPGIALSGLARQRVVLPCFVDTGTVFLLPAFGRLTGLSPVTRSREHNIYAVLPDCVRQV